MFLWFALEWCVFKYLRMAPNVQVMIFGNWIHSWHLEVLIGFKGVLQLERG